MNKILNVIKDWSEVWATLIPLTIYLIKRPRYKWLKPILFYLLVTLVLYLVIDIIWKRRSLGLDNWFKENFQVFYDENGFLKNTIFYNFVSIARLLFLSWFFNYMDPIYKKLNRYIPLFFLILTAVNFIFFEKIEDFSSRLITLEAFILLVYCILFFFKILRSERIETNEERNGFRVVIGLSIYVAVNFFIFLLYKQLTVSFRDFAKAIWPFHNAVNLIFCIFISIAFWNYGRSRTQ